MVETRGRLDFWDCGEFEGDFTCECGAKIGFLGHPTGNLDVEKDWTMWCHKDGSTIFNKRDDKLKCSYCNSEYVFLPDIFLKKL